MDPNPSEEGTVPHQSANKSTETFPDETSTTAESATKQLIAKLKLIADNLEEVIWQSTPINTEQNSSNTSSSTMLEDSFLHLTQKNDDEPIEDIISSSHFDITNRSCTSREDTESDVSRLTNEICTLTDANSKKDIPSDHGSDNNKSPMAGPSKCIQNQDESVQPSAKINYDTNEHKDYLNEDGTHKTPEQYRTTEGHVFRIQYTPPPRQAIRPEDIPVCILQSIKTPTKANGSPEQINSRKKDTNKSLGSSVLIRQIYGKASSSGKKKIEFEQLSKNEVKCNEDLKSEKDTVASTCEDSPVAGTSGNNESCDDEFVPVCTCHPMDDELDNTNNLVETLSNNQSNEQYCESSCQTDANEESHNQKTLDNLDHIATKDTPEEELSGQDFEEEKEDESVSIQEILANKLSVAGMGSVNTSSTETVETCNLPLAGSSASRTACLGKNATSFIQGRLSLLYNIRENLFGNNIESEDDSEESISCTCPSYSDSEDEANGGEYKEEEDPTVGTSDGEGPCLSPDRLKRKRKADSPSSGDLKKSCFDPNNPNIPENIQDNPPDVLAWIGRFCSWSGSERLHAIDLLIKRCAADQVRHMMHAIEPLFQRDFISLLPRELALSVLGFLEPKDLLRAAQTCRYWRFLADDNLLWKEQCQRVGIVALRRRPRTMPVTTGPWKAAYMRQHTIENNWLNKPMTNFKVLKGHDDHVITCLQFYGNKILSGSDDTTLKVWSAISGRCLHTLCGHTGGVWSSQMVGRTVISGSTDRTLRVWDAESGHCLRILVGHTSTVRCMHLFNDRVVSGSRDATLRVWSVTDGSCLKVLVGHMAAVRCVQYDGRLVVSGAYDYFVKVWNPETAECLHTLAGHTNRVYSLQFDGIHVVSGSLDTSIMVWDVETGAQKHTLMGHQSLTSGMELRSNILVSGNADSTVKIWDIISGQCLHTLSGHNKHQSAVTCLQTNNRFVITSSDDGTVKLWDIRTGEFIRNLVSLGSGGSGGVVWRIRSSATKLVCAVGSRNGTEETKLLVLDFDVPGACVKCDE